MKRSLRIPAILGAALAATACAHAGGGRAEMDDLGQDLPGAPAAERAAFTVDTPVGRLCAHPAAKAVVDRDLPGLTARPEYMLFKGLSLRALQAMSHGRMTEAELSRVAADLALLPPPDKPRRPRLFRLASSLRP